MKTSKKIIWIDQNVNNYKNANTLKILKSQLKNSKFSPFTSVTCAFELHFLFQF